MGWTGGVAALLAGASVTDWPVVALTLAPPLLIGAALASVPGGPPHASGRARTLVDGLIVAGSVLFVAWALGLKDLYQAADWPYLAATTAWVSMAGAATVILTRAPGETRPLLGRLAAGLTALAIGMGALAYIAMDGSAGAVRMLYVAFPIGWALVALAGLGATPAGRDPEPELPGRGSVFIPSTPFAIGILFAALEAARGDFDDFLIWTGAGVLVLIVMRQILSLAENISFWQRLRARVEAQNDELRLSEARFRSLIQNSSDVVTLIAPDGRVLYQSQSIGPVFGHPSIREPSALLELVHPDDRSLVAQAARELEGRPGHTVTLAGRIAHRDGSWRNAEAVVANHLRDPAVSAFVVNIRDVSRRKAAERKLRQLSAELEQKVDELAAANEELESFNYSVSHDLRAPLRAMDGFSEAVLEDYGPRLDDEGRRLLARVRAASQRMEWLIDGLLMLSRLTRKDPRRRPIDLSAMAEEVAAELRAQDPERPEPDLLIEERLTTDGDPTLLRLVLHNLLENAWKFSAASDRPRIEFRRLHEN